VEITVEKLGTGSEDDPFRPDCIGGYILISKTEDTMTIKVSE